MSNDGIQPPEIAGGLLFADVGFRYPSRQNATVLQGFNLRVEAGTTVALVGGSGQGKSTVISLLERFYDVDSGSICLDGVNIKELSLPWLRSQIGVVSQEPALFALSIADNIRQGKLTASNEEVAAAARLANAHDFIERFPEGYNTQVGDKGIQLSGGQKQRIAIARAIIRDPAILLLDEATSALDSESERLVQEALDRLLAMRRRTTLVIAHRLSTIRNADTIAVVRDGCVIEQGSHKELIEMSGYYFQLVQLENRSGQSDSR